MRWCGTCTEVGESLALGSVEVVIQISASTAVITGLCNSFCATLQKRTSCNTQHLSISRILVEIINHISENEHLIKRPVWHI